MKIIFLQLSDLPVGETPQEHKNNCAINFVEKTGLMLIIQLKW